MDEQASFTCGQIVFGLMGIFFLWYFYSFRTGKNKYMHLRAYKGDRWRRGMSYSAPFVGTFMLFLVLMNWVASILPGILAGFIFIGLPIAMVVAVIWQPVWMKPKWLHWLEQNHSDIIPILREDITHNRIGLERLEWRKQVKTQEGFEEWVEEVRRSHGL